jgi:hypothetical protein
MNIAEKHLQRLGIAVFALDCLRRAERILPAQELTRSGNIVVVEE